MNIFYEFESFRIDGEKRLFWGNGELISIKPKTFDTLLALLKNNNKIISKDNLIKEIWNGDAVSDDSLTQQISQLRKLLGESADEHKFIVTVSGVGYKFVADVQKVTDGNSGSVQGLLQDKLSSNESRVSGFKAGVSDAKEEKQIGKSHEKSIFIQKRFWIIAFVVFSILGSAAVYFWQASKTSKITSVLEVKKIAVLPFEIIPTDERMNSLKQGLKSELITRLSKIEKLNLLSNASVADYEKSGMDSISFGKILNVEAVLDGTIRRQGDSVSVTAQLIRVSDGKVLWSEMFTNDLTDVTETQRLIAYKISETLSLELVESEERTKMKRSTTSAEAYRLYLDAKYLIYMRKGGESRELAKKSLNTAIQLDPNFALAYSLLASMESDEPTQEGYQRMKVLAKKALDLDENLAEAYTSYGFAVWRGDWNWTDAEKHFAKANRLDTNSAGASSSYNLVLIGQRKFKEAHEFFDSKPVKFAAPTPDQIAIYYYERNYEKVIELCLDRLNQIPGDADALSYLALAYIESKKKEEAIKASREYASFDELVGVGGLVYLGYAHAKFGEKHHAGEIVQQLTSKNLPPSSQIHGGLAMVYGELGDKDKAFEHIEKSIENREWWAFTLKVAPYYDSLRNDPRFDEMMKKINLD